MASSDDLLDRCERSILAHLQVPYRQAMVHIKMPDGAMYHINTLETMVPNASITAPLVMLHGFAGGLAIFLKNIDSLAQISKVYVVDGLGWGKSSRPTFPTEV